MADNEKGREEDAELMADDSEPRSSDNKLVLAREILPERLPIIPLDQRPVFPRMTVPMVIDNADLKKALLEAAGSQTRYVGLVLRRHANGDGDAPPLHEDLHEYGVVAEILRGAHLSEDGPIQLLLGVLERFRIDSIVRTEPVVVARVEYVHETEMADNVELKAYSVSVIQCIKELVELNPLHKQELNLLMSQTSLHEPGRLADFGAALTSADGKDLQRILETISIRSRLHETLMLLRKEIDISKLQAKINKQIEEKLSKQQREFFLREQLKAIKKELGIEKEGKETEVERFEKRLEDLTLTPEAEERVKDEIEKLKLIEPSSPEFNVSRNYLDWLTILPWGVSTDDSYDIKRARKILDRDHYGLDDVKDRILEFLSVGMLKGNMAGSILCFVGPPGVGKTSIGRSIANSIGRNFYRFSVGGIHDEAEIKGHRRTYIGALPGKFIQAMRTCKSDNPVIMLDEIDKIGASYHGDPASALLEVLDPEQNKDFLDHYLDVRFDLSNVFFICTANQLDTIPRPLLDRMEVIKLSGYILAEKMQIARRFLVPKQLKAHGVERGKVKIPAATLRALINGYAREPGVRGLEKHIKRIFRKSVKQIVEGETETITVQPDDLTKLLGKKLFRDERLYKTPHPGVIMGLAWTSMGGDTLFIEASAVDTGKAGFKQTGQLGKVMVESSEIAYTVVRAYLDTRADAKKFLDERSVHLHVPAGATPKDGPSAGITMACALYSLVVDVPIKSNFAMTGELSLTGRVMPVGGIKEKTIAARRAGVKNLVLPADNERDFTELPDHIRRGLKVHYVRTFEETLGTVFPKQKRDAR